MVKKILDHLSRISISKNKIFPISIKFKLKPIPVDHYHNLNNKFFDQHIQLTKIFPSILSSLKILVYLMFVSIIIFLHLIQMQIHLHLKMQHKVVYYLLIIVEMKHNYYSIHISKYISMIFPKG